MPTNQKTPLGLNSWLGTDKPKRSDFVDDNTLLDGLLTGHFNDASKHLAAGDRTLLTQAFVMGGYTGSGAAQQSVTLPFEARLVIVFCLRSPALAYRSGGGYYENNFSIVGPGGGMTGLYLDKAKLTVTQGLTVPSAGGIRTNLNAEDEEYVYIAFR